jgi:ferritin-like metal-binding protein YciE
MTGAIRASARTTTMGLFSKDIKTLNDLFVHQLKDIYYAENRIAKTLPDMIKKATNAELKAGFETHLAQTKTHIANVEQVFKQHGVEVDAVTCPAIDGILKEADEVASEVADKQVLDAALIAAAQAVEHYEMTRYGTLVAWAKKLGRDDCAAVLEKNLADEKEADAKLTRLAETEINRLAA